MFVVGQRWISNTELSLGLGTVTHIENRDVTIDFAGSQQRRVYAMDNAPLSRISFTVGDPIRDIDGKEWIIQSVHDNKGLFIYLCKDQQGNEQIIDEGRLDHQLQLNRPGERLFSGQIDADKWFALRYQSLLHKNRLAHSPLFGLSGVRTSLIPHQLYIAHEVANRYAPRVLLADEVGLGKTIEAGLILHHQLLTERAKRVLIVVPESLLHQWLVEMLRRFNLFFSLFDAKRYEELRASDPENNPFFSEQLILCSLEFLVNHPDSLQQATKGEWDLLIVDEAHHLQWSASNPSKEYRCIEQLAEQTKGVLLLTATPEQLGKSSHFARLRLLDKDRFSDYQQFLQEEQCFAPIAQVIDSLLSNDTLEAEQQQQLADILAEDDQTVLLQQLQQAQTGEEKQAIENAIINHLVDRHGTGRVLFRNTRHAIKGFPQRQAHLYPLPQVPEYQQYLAELEGTPLADQQLLLSPELLYQAFEHKQRWFDIDPRVPWLIEQLKQLYPQKVLLIAASADTVLDLAEALRIKAGIAAAVFHEGISIVERDRAAAFFADSEDGTQLLLCSEIGSEGRNFQFAHHLILFDLPANPDLLEQRIGRLDRIGQSQTIHIHLPYSQNSAAEVMAHWYHHGLNALEHTCPAGLSVYQQFETQLQQALCQQQTDNKLIEQTAQALAEINRQLQQGRDRLLEYNSCRMETAQQLAQQCTEQDQDNTLRQYMEQVFDCFGIDAQEHSEHCFILHPTEYMLESFPYLQEDGMTITYNRDIALSKENYHFLTWEHPMVQGALDMSLGSEYGNTALASIQYPLVPAGSIIAECIFVLEPLSNSQLQTSRYMPPTTIRIVLDENGRQHQQKLSHSLINKHQQRIDKKIKPRIIAMKQNEIRHLLDQAQTEAEKQAPKILEQAHQSSRNTLLEEIERLKALQKINPNIRQDEIRFFEQQYQALNKMLDQARIRLDAVRLLVNT